MMTTLALATPPTPPIRTPRPPLAFSAEYAPDLRRQTAGDLRHRVEQRQTTGRQLHGLVRDRGDLLVDELFGQWPVGGQVKVGEQNQALAQPVVLLGDRLLDLEHHVGVAPDLVGSVEQLRPGGLELSVVIDDPTPARTLDEDLVTALDELVHADGRDRHPVLVVLDFLRDADLHVPHSLLLREHFILTVWCGVMRARNSTASERSHGETPYNELGRFCCSDQWFSVAQVDQRRVIPPL